MGAVKRGWVRQFVVVCDFKLFLYDITAERSALPTVHVAQVLDMRDPEFAVSGVRESDVIHAAKKDVPCIFRVIINNNTVVWSTTYHLLPSAAQASTLLTLTNDIFVWLLFYFRFIFKIDNNVIVRRWTITTHINVGRH